MKSLNISTSTKNCSVAVFSDSEQVVVVEKFSENYSHSENLHTYIKKAIEEASIEFSQLDFISIDKGPGSYTGLRIGVTAAKGLCYALNIPLVSVNSLEILRQGFERKIVIPHLDARRMDIYTLDFTEKSYNKVLLHTLSDSSFLVFKNEKEVVFVGDKNDEIRNMITLSNAKYVDRLPSARAMQLISLKKYQNKSFENLAYFEPIYKLTK